MSTTDDEKEDVRVKREHSDDSDYEEEEEEQSFGPAALGLHRVGEKLPEKKPSTKPIQVLNARGMPARIRKKNKLFYDDELYDDSQVKGSPKKNEIKVKPATPQKSLKKRKTGSAMKYKREREDDYVSGNPKFSSIDKKASQKIGLSLRNLLKLPKAHKFVSYEWFYSNIDKALFCGDNDFQVCLRDMFPAMKTRFLTRIEWNKVRRQLGKPRRCSPAFFEQERRDLERKRQKIRLLQTKKSGDVTFVRDLPNEVPLPFSVGTKVTARLRSPQDGLFIGTVEAIDNVFCTYRISFDRPGLGTHNIPDFEICANETQETISLKSLTKDYRPKFQNASFIVTSPAKSQALRGDPLLGGAKMDSKILFPKDSIGGYPIKLLELIVRTKKTLSAKQMKLLRLQNMNSEAEIYKSYGDPIPDEYQKRYAGLILGMEKLNRDLTEQLNQLQVISKGLVNDPAQEAILCPSYLREECKAMSNETFDRNNNGQVTNEHMTRLIKDLSTIMYVASNMTNNERYTHCLSVLQGCMEDTRNHLDCDNLATFHRSVQVHLRHVELEALETTAEEEEQQQQHNGEENTYVDVDDMITEEMVDEKGATTTTTTIEITPVQ